MVNNYCRAMRRVPRSSLQQPGDQSGDAQHIAPGTDRRLAIVFFDDREPGALSRALQELERVTDGKYQQVVLWRQVPGDDTPMRVVTPCGPGRHAMVGGSVCRRCHQTSDAGLKKKTIALDAD